MNDINKTVHYTTHAQEICASLLSFIPENVILIEPFVGDGDLVKLFPNHVWETYDIMSNYSGAIQQDTLLNPPNYKGKWVITNPPFLAKNKAKEKEIYKKYNLDDLYKIALYNSLEAEGGIFIIPTNFFTDENSEKVRKQFLNNFIIKRLNIFTTPIFETTTYSVCSFAFEKKENHSQKIQTFIYPEEKELILELNERYGYRISGEEYAILNSQKNYFSRLTATTPQNKFITNIKLYALDTRKEKIHTTYGEEPFVGKNTDRTYLTFVCDKEINENIQKQLSINFNIFMNNFREKYSDLGMTNYRDYNRKRISFNFAYQILSYELDQILKEEK